MSLEKRVEDIERLLQIWLKQTSMYADTSLKDVLSQNQSVLRSLEDQLHSLNKRLNILEKEKEDELRKLKKLREQMESFLENRDA
ncbi:MAG: hypothetical protein NE328_24035 [Lentisphaeraceae bacterium]|nr:hypothetical protein [Lentisphaeraceae bacterium]